MLSPNLHDLKQSRENIIVSYWAQQRLKSPASRLFTQLFIQVQIKENIEAPNHWPLRGKLTGNWSIPHTKG